MRLWWEAHHPKVIAFVGGLACLVVTVTTNIRVPESFKLLLQAGITLAGIVVGFLSTANSVLMSQADRPVVTELRKHGHYKSLLRYLRATVNWAFALGGMSALGLLLDSFSKTDWYTYTAAIWVTVGIGFVTSFRLVTAFFFEILENQAERMGGAEERKAAGEAIKKTETEPRSTSDS